MAPVSALFSAILLPALVFAQSSSTTTTLSAAASRTTVTTTSSSASGTATATLTSSTGYPAATLAVNQGSKGYEYAGCWNETQGFTQGGGVRALSGGTINATDKMTPEVCFDLCDGSQFAGLEYGRDPYLSSLSTELPEGACGIPCKANETEACGGSWALSLYNRTSDAVNWGPGVAGRNAVWGAVVVAGMTAAAGFALEL
ncbi:hypothetical protein SLS58_003395 [Diplodia intermedia]|uniref:WSC domain-containing protein n=1 Tax=Diplodia intermedia TaxID=856260 RepID=A0ABR3TXJ1_9PEZI